MLKLTELIELSDVELLKYKIHCATGKAPNSPLDAFFAGTFQDWQERQNQLNFQCDQIISLIYLRPSRWLFGGLYRVLGFKEGRPDMPSGFTYQTELIKGLEHLDGRAVIYFDKKFRASYLRGRKYAEQLIVESLRSSRMTIGDFPGFNDVLLSFPNLRTIIGEQNPSWRAALANVSGVYLIVDNTTGEIYVGSAYGGVGIWQRWSQYARTGHGGNKALKALLASEPDGHEDNFQISLLEVCDLYASNDFVISREVHWKNVLKSREFGLNAN
ncbi:GIY-YIG nuclease family protein [Roseiconus lacunae]|uniref:GIY-YIG nuclease family protein n=1 Tax=Roseiconus lacunae TaxID=2605694 RepID=UPI00135B8DE3|nr:GIY-YIG nuclease family protein [Roseiconus lacunae]